MNQAPKNEPDDPIWELLRQSPRRLAGPRFVDDTLRATRLASPPPLSWWHRLWLPLSLGGLATVVTAVFTLFIISQNPEPPSAPPITGNQAPFDESLAVLDDLVRTEVLSLAADHPANFTDAELVSLISY